MQTFAASSRMNPFGFWCLHAIVFLAFTTNVTVVNTAFFSWTFLKSHSFLASVCRIFVPVTFLIRFFLSAAFCLLSMSCDIRIITLCFSLFLKAILSLGRTMNLKCYLDAGCVWIPSVTDEADGFYFWIYFMWMLKVLLLSLLLESLNCLQWRKGDAELHFGWERKH